ncbi:alpha-L-fucosidase, partial [Hyphomonas beringensis]
MGQGDGVVTQASRKTQAQYDASAESLQAHEAPDWFLDAKFGIFIHW